ncbi:Trans-resveratrol di-O-methyltransferase [Bertholletia excelsa]
MDIPKNELGRKLLRSQAHVLNHEVRFVNSMTLKCAIQLGIPDIIHNHGRPMTLAELVTALPINPSKAQAVLRLMRVLVHFNFFSKEKVKENDEEDGYSLTPASRLLLKDEPLRIRPFFFPFLDQPMIAPWHHMSEWFQNDDPTPFHTAYGRGLWEHATQEPRLSQLVNEAMASDSLLVMEVLIKERKGVFEGLNLLVDVGGGTGALAMAMVDAFPNINITVLDLPHVIAGLQGKENLSYVGGDMFKAIPSADAVLLKVYFNFGTMDHSTVYDFSKELGTTLHLFLP